MKKITSKLAALAAVAALAPSVGSAAISTIDVTGWNQDMIINNGQGAVYSGTVTGTLDGGPNNFEGYTFAEAGTYPVYVETEGQPPVTVPTSVSGVSSSLYTSATGDGSTFQLQPFTSNNALLLNGNDVGTLTLAVPSSLSVLALYGTTAGGPTSASVTLTFSDLSTSTYTITNGSGITADWFNNGDNTAALVVGDRLSNRSEDGYTNLFYQQNDSISIYESSIALNTEDQGKLITSIGITNTNGGTLAVMAVSGQVVPEASTASLIATCGLVGLLRRRRA